MWPRVVEFMLACWLAASPFIFRHREDETALWVVDLSVAALVMALSAATFHRRLRLANLGTLAAAVGLCTWAYWASLGETPAPGALQNQLLVGLLWMMFAVIPTNCNEPPRRWRSAFALTGKANY